MRHIKCSCFFFLLFSVQALQHSLIGASETVPPPSFPSLSQQNKSCTRNSNLVSSDFDGDGKPDLATGRFDGQSYQIEIQLSTQRSHISLASGQAKQGVFLLVRDVDLDNDQDLVLVSYTSLLPVAVWLNDGKANFEVGSRWLWPNLLTKDNPSSVDRDNFPVVAVSLTESYRFPLDRSVSVFLAQKLKSQNWVVAEFPALRLSLSAYHLSPRGPPLRYS